jgi:hypothetical protein
MPRRKIRGGSAGHVILKVLRGLMKVLGGPTSLAEAKRNYIANTKTGGRKARRRVRLVRK